MKKKFLAMLCHVLVGIDGSEVREDVFDKVSKKDEKEVELVVLVKIQRVIGWA